MNKSTTIKFTITFIAIFLALAHILFPEIKIDYVFLSILTLAIIPWLAPLFKSVELPGGVKVEFQELKKVEQEAKNAGLITEVISEENSPFINESFSFIEIAEKNPDLALVAFRIEIEKRLRRIAEKYDVSSHKFSVFKLIENLTKHEILSSDMAISLKNIITTLNQAAHGIEFDSKNVDWVLENGPKILSTLDEKIEKRGGIFSVGRSNEKQHWIEKSFEECHWTTNKEWGECISNHRDQWEKELDRIYKSLLSKLNSPQKDLLISTQDNWKRQIELEQDFLFSFDLKNKVGREGYLVAAQTFMYKVSSRALELEEVLNNLANS